MFPREVDHVGLLPTGRVFDNDVSFSDEFNFSQTGGDDWEGKAERDMITKVLALHFPSRWAEAEWENVSGELLARAVGDRLTTFGRDDNPTNHLAALNCAVCSSSSNSSSSSSSMCWGFYNLVGSDFLSSKNRTYESVKKTFSPAVSTKRLAFVCLLYVETRTRPRTHCICACLDFLENIMRDGYLILCYHNRCGYAR